MSLKDKTVSGLLWNFGDRFATHVIALISGIILARILSPREFGLIGMLMIFVEVSNIFINSGFNEALIRKKDCSEKDYSTVFYFNLVASLFIYFGLFFSAEGISNFYDEPRLEPIVKILGISVVINALTIVQRTKITKRIDFKLLTKISVISSLASGIMGIVFALNGYGVWSLVYKTLLLHFFTGLLLWVWNKWTPLRSFSMSSFKELFGFGSRLMTLGIIDAVYNNIYHVIIGKFYPVANVGQYTQADKFKRLPSQTLGDIIGGVNYPVLSSIQDDKERYRKTFKRVLGVTMLVSLILLIGLGAIAKEFIVLLMGEKWALAGEYLQILCFSAVFRPMNKLNNTILKIAGRSDLVLRIGILLKFAAIPVILTAIFIGIEQMLYALVVHQFIEFVVVAYNGGKYANHPLLDQFKDMMAPSIISLSMFFVLVVIGYLVEWSIPALFVLKLSTGTLFVYVLLEAFRLDNYIYLKATLREKLTRSARHDSDH
jgi:O-antigen/teichoic acid export membrane protein